METHVAIRKPHRCHLCGKRIPIGSRYFASEGGYEREHTNCMDYSDEPILDEWFNHNRKFGEVGYTEDSKIDSFGRLIDA